MNRAEVQAAIEAEESAAERQNQIVELAEGVGVHANAKIPGYYTLAEKDLFDVLQRLDPHLVIKFEQDA